MKMLVLLILTAICFGCMPRTNLEIIKSDGTVVKFSSAKDQVVKGLEADIGNGTISIQELESSLSKSLEAQSKREQSVAEALLGLMVK